LLKIQSCQRCGGNGYIPEYQHIQNGICFLCWGEGINIFDTGYPELNESLKKLIQNETCTTRQTQLVKDITHDIKSYFYYNSQLHIAKEEEELDAVNYYRGKMNAIITKLYTLNKSLKAKV
jgi:hypothetical protein